MAYPAGYIEISKERDLPLLKEALHAGFVTHTQLFALMQLCALEDLRYPTAKLLTVSTRLSVMSSTTSSCSGSIRSVRPESRSGS